MGHLDAHGDALLLLGFGLLGEGGEPYQRVTDPRHFDGIYRSHIVDDDGELDALT